MFTNWIDDVERVTHDLNSKIKVFDLKTIDISESILKDISKRVLISLCNPENVKFQCSGEDLDDLKKYIKNHVIPEKDSLKNVYIQKSTWGEIISAEVLKEFRNHLLPIYRLRHKEKKNFAMRSDADVLSCVCSNDNFFIALSEVKTNGDTYYSPKKYQGIINDAYCHLLKNDIDEPEVINHMNNLLINEGKYDLAKIFNKHFKNFSKRKKEFHIFLIREKRRWKDDVLKMFKDNCIKCKKKDDEYEYITLPNNLIINIVLIDQLNEIINSTYELIPEIAEEVVYNDE
ncbi:MAG: hypothetical protein LBM96_01740 [Methanobrevibacter sp.]|jgi:hypothetical protein|nr:hypothetical protein [Candidatus Methanoflexus mossambicus]